MGAHLDEERTIWLMMLLWKKEGLTNPTRKPVGAVADGWSPGFWEPVLTFTEASGQHALHALWVSPAQPGLCLDPPASLLPSSLLFPPCTNSEDSSSFIFMSTQDGVERRLIPPQNVSHKCFKSVFSLPSPHHNSPWRQTTSEILAA